MNLTLEQLRMLDVVHRSSSVSEAARKLNRVPSAVLYSMKQLEIQLDLKIFDRTKYRTSLTPAGVRLWQESQHVIESENRFKTAVQNLKHEWEPYLKIVYDGVFDAHPILETLKVLKKMNSSTQVRLYSEYLSQVESVFETEKADLMLTLLPPESTGLTVEKLKPIVSYLVAHPKHPIVRKDKSSNLEDLQKHTFLTVRGSDFRLRQSTAKLEPLSQYQLSDFSTKKQALLEGLGYGWMPESLVRDELKNKKLALVNWKGKNTHSHQPLLVHRGKEYLGRSGQLFLENLIQIF